MEKNKWITLITDISTEEDDDGFSTKKETKETEVFAGTKSVGRSEYYEAARNGMKASIIFVVDRSDFEMGIWRDEKGKKKKPSKISYDGDLYRIIRTYVSGDDDDMEITCEEVE